MLDYSIIFAGESDGGRKFTTILKSEEVKVVQLKVYNTYFNCHETCYNVTMFPGREYWNYIINNNSNRYVEFRDTESWELVGLFGLKGEINLEEYDYDSYAKRISKKIPSDKRVNLCSVFNEIVCHGTYFGEFIDIEENDIVVDIGFNYGLFSTTSLFKKPSKVIGFEPNPHLVKIFKENFHDDRIQLFNYAVSDVDSRVTFYENADYGMSTIKKDFHSEKKVNEYEVDCISIDTLIKKFELEKIDYLKVDCEGSEFEIFESLSENYLRTSIRKIAIEFHGPLHGEEVQKLISKLERCGFEIRIKNEHEVPLGIIYAKKKRLTPF